MGPDFAQWVIGQAGVAGLAALALYLLNRTHDDAKAREKEFAEANRADKVELLNVLREITRALASLESAIEDVQRNAK